MSSHITADVMAISFGLPRRDDIIRAVGRLVRDDLAPKFLAEIQKKEIKQSLVVVRLI
jgi:hypothetical protein